MNEVPGPELKHRQVHPIGRRGGPDALQGGNAVVGILITTLVTVMEGRHEARDATNTDEEGGEVLVGHVAGAIVGEDRVEELEEEDCPCWEDLDEVSSSCVGLVCDVLRR